MIPSVTLSIGWCGSVACCTARRLACSTFVIYMVFYAVHDSAAERGDHEDSFFCIWAVREQRVPVITDGDIDIKSFQQADVVA